MIRWPARLLACLLLMAPASAAEDAVNDIDTVYVRNFFNEMVTGIGAQETKCSTDVREQVQSREMRVACATFAGEFQHFETRWNIQLLRIEAAREFAGMQTHPVAVPQTAWEHSGEGHARIYRVGDAALGIRYAPGELLMVW